MKMFYLLCGLPGSFKSTEARKIAKANPGALTVSGDALREMLYAGYDYVPSMEATVRGIAYHAVDTALTAPGVTCVIYDACNIRKQGRKDFLRTAKFQGYHTTILHCLGDGQNLARRMENPRGFGAERWASAIEGMRKNFEPPEPDEADVVITVSGVSNG